MSTTWLAALLVAAPTVQTAFERFLRSDIPPADGFDFPVGDGDGGGSYTDRQTKKQHEGWYVATHFGASYSLGIHPGEDWNGRGGGNTDFGQPVRSAGPGRVVFAKHAPDPWGGVIVIEHIYYENHQKKRIRSQYAHLSRLDVAKGDAIKRRQIIGAIGRDPSKTFPAHLHFEIRSDPSVGATYWPSSNGRTKAWVTQHYLSPTTFIRAHRKTPIPQKEATLILVDPTSHRMQILKHGKLQKEVEVTFGQATGRKRRQGDLKTPRGMYFVTSHYRGKISGPYGEYYGGHWIKVNYPNRYDAAWGLANGLVTQTDAKEISRKFDARKLTKQSTRLGGGIGFHGWISDWELEDGGLSWGCVVMHNRDIKKLYDEMKVGAMVVIL